MPVNEPDDVAVAFLKLHGGNGGGAFEAGKSCFFHSATMTEWEKCGRRQNLLFGASVPEKILKFPLTELATGNNILPQVRFMSHDQMFSLVCELLRDSPGTEDVEITMDSNPFEVLGKDSHDGIVFACLLSERLGIEIDPELNPLVDDQHHRARLVGEIVDWSLARLQISSKKL